jgi:hypothetical protein
VPYAKPVALNITVISEVFFCAIATSAACHDTTVMQHTCTCCCCCLCSHLLDHVPVSEDAGCHLSQLGIQPFQHLCAWAVGHRSERCVMLFDSLCGPGPGMRGAAAGMGTVRRALGAV